MCFIIGRGSRILQNWIQFTPMYLTKSVVHFLQNLLKRKQVNDFLKRIHDRAKMISVLLRNRLKKVSVISVWRYLNSEFWMQESVVTWIYSESPPFCFCGFAKTLRLILFVIRMVPISAYLFFHSRSFATFSFQKWIGPPLQ